MTYSNLRYTNSVHEQYANKYTNYITGKFLWSHSYVVSRQIKTHGSESRGQEEAAVRDERVSYLHVALL